MNEHSARLRAAPNARKLQRLRGRSRLDFLLVDISNSFTKIAFASRVRLYRAVSIPTNRMTSACLGQFLAKRDATRVIASSVVPAKNREISRAAGTRPLLWLTPDARLNITIDYPHPQTIGADRLANAVAVTELYGTPAVVIDFGTAVTFDVVSRAAAYVGGVIAPGLEAMTNFLYDRTALLPRISLREPQRAVGKSTREAMIAGAVLGYRGLVREILRCIVAERFRGRGPHVVATGGYAKLIAAELPEIAAVHENLTLDGLRLVGCMNE